MIYFIIIFLTFVALLPFRITALAPEDVAQHQHNATSIRGTEMHVNNAVL